MDTRMLRLKLFVLFITGTSYLTLVSALSVEKKYVDKTLLQSTGKAHSEIQEITTLHEYVSDRFSEMSLKYRDSMTVLSKKGSDISVKGLIYAATVSQFYKNFSRNVAEELIRFVSTPELLQYSCPFREAITCDKNSIYRTASGSCNNLNYPYWGKSYTPLLRMRPPYYEDTVFTPRNISVQNAALPGARDISVYFHQKIEDPLMDHDTTHLAAVFGEFLMRDIAYVPTMQASSGKRYDCCKFGYMSGHMCMPIQMCKVDPFFTPYNRKCLSFARSATSPPLNCKLGPREQLNQNTHYIDVSQIYGSDEATTKSLRTMVAGKMKTSDIGDGMMPLDLFNVANCKLKNVNGNITYCFTGGDDRLNENPLILSLHAVFLREHNRIATHLSSMHPTWDDEKIFQESRRIVIAEMQHITYNEYLPYILGPQLMAKHDLNVQNSGYTSYDSQVSAGIYNVFSVAAGLYSTSMIRSNFTIDTYHKLSSTFLRADMFYRNEDVASKIIKGMLTDSSQTVDRYVTDELTNKYLESFPGTGIDLAADHIQRGRDHGIMSYPMWTIKTGEPRWSNFKSLTNHSTDNQARLSQIYRNIYDIDLWTAGISEIPVLGGKVGPTFGNIIAKQFEVLKNGDRFWYENNDKGAFSRVQLQEIRKVSLTEILCRNTRITEIQKNSFVAASESNPLVKCGTLAKIDLCKWGPPSHWLAWGSWSLCYQGTKLRRRICQNNSKIVCPCQGSSMEIRPCQNRYVPPVQQKQHQQPTQQPTERVMQQTTKVFLSHRPAPVMVA
ncbi:chorion peroxidase [Octopus bimaculoides]|uniref:Uncharacterized protein n=2 Tax=Octopus bimaculoides TaxID=37653 RepID=A0A0L8HLX2_OCTBM|nr:chorion peroxidase [Octopus bimaculoides]|eukprot:XP_014771227.1 PREDICTED: chorion peroxidase-like [Octopus bimaculoides]